MPPDPHLRPGYVKGAVTFATEESVQNMEVLVRNGTFENVSHDERAVKAAFGMKYSIRTGNSNIDFKRFWILQAQLCWLMAIVVKALPTANKTPGVPYFRR